MIYVKMDKLQVELHPGGCITRSMISVKGGTSGSGGVLLELWLVSRGINE